jgi:MFS transporter, ACS family, glucarate transporter
LESYHPVGNRLFAVGERGPVMPADNRTVAVPLVAPPATRVRYGVLAFLCALSFILYIDRICISQAVLPIRSELGITEPQMGYVLGAFTVAYGLFEVPTGRWGDRYGSRGVLTRVVIWWSVFTALTGAAGGLVMLLVVRFLFGAGEAGALPNACRVIARWFPPGGRGFAQGMVVTSAQVGGALAPVGTAYLIKAVGWRASFAIFGSLGAAWAAAFYVWYRDDPAQHPAVNEAESRLITGGMNSSRPAEVHPPVPWSRILTNPTVWLMGAIMASASALGYMYFSWYPTYLQDARAVSPVQSGWLSGLVLAGGAAGGISGGVLSDYVVRRTGLRRWARRGLGVGGLGVGALALVASVRVDDPVASAWLAALASFSAQVQLSSWWAVVTEISGRHVGVMFGLMNSMGVPGAVASQLFVGYFIHWLGEFGYTGRARWDPAFYVFAAVLLGGALCWLFVNAARRVDEPWTRECSSDAHSG